MSTLVYIFLFVALVLAVGLLNSFRVETKKVKIDTPFQSKWSNKLYKYSYYMPFVWFIDEKEEHPKTKDLKNKLAQANLTHLFNVRSFTALKVGVMMSSIVLFIFILVIMSNGDWFAKVLFNVDSAGLVSQGQQSSNANAKIMAFIILLCMALVPDFYLKRRAEAYKHLHLKDIPVVQLFIILMLRSKKPISEVLFALSKINTRYKGIFDIGYRMYIRNKEDGLNYIKDSFGETSFKETINVLKEMGEYSREDSITLLENNMQQIIEKNNAVKRRGDLSRLVYSQSTIAIPFIAIILLCFVPLAVFGIEIFTRAGMGF
ncbi:hypothetical protein CVD28_04855 [Bacillus sp. M6-12]|uniref:hypothetical protein n=1 Tax=Bacillus sp. M6-12 TaxID=2054166 RepID=UPI000C794550|nr:hypothetical protein [Bacillus sp. M6-12]PLS19743.1 hypothetical protein CVD28_04855 [Bacillus sp. M6-12]